jgi:IAA-amino acid hydrolase
MLKGGDAFNVIPESVTIGGTFRSMTDKGLSFLMKRVKEVNENTISSHLDSQFLSIMDIPSPTN